MKHSLLIVLVFCIFYVGRTTAQNLNSETFIPFKGGNVPQTVDQLWKDFDPRNEPLDVEILKEWQEDGVVIKVLRYRIGIFKGQKAMMAAIYGYPKDGKSLPGLVQIHGGGQYADYRAVLTNAKRGYATISISWAGRINAPGYIVDHATVKLFMENKTNDPDYKITTDWGAVDGYHDPSRNPENSFFTIPTSSWTLDSVKSPRNNSWFLCTIGARRALTFLEQQPEVNPDKLGVYGHSMGGKLTVLTTGSDVRVKASAPSCGGISDRYNEDTLYRNTIVDDAYLKEITCPIIFLSPSNDFHGHINDLQTTVTEIKSNNWRVTCSPHHDHQDTPEYMVTGLLWFDQYLKGTFKFPETPQSKLDLNTINGLPIFIVTPDDTKPVSYVDIYYTQQGQTDGKPDDRENTINRFWHHAWAKQKGNTWTADLPLFTTEKPLWVYANVVYPLEQPITGANYYYDIYTASKFNISSLMRVATPGQLKEKGVKATLKPSRMIETFSGNWEKEWFTYTPKDWSRKTHKLYDDQWKAPAKAKLVLEVRSEQPNKLVVGIDKFATEIRLKGGSQWQQIVMTTNEFHDVTGNVLPNWNYIKEMRLGSAETLSIPGNDAVKPIKLGAEWKGEKPEFKNLRWVE